MGERRKTRGQEGPSKVPGLPFPLSQPADMADGARDSTFADPNRAVPWLSSASGHVLSCPGGRHDAPGCQAVTLRGADGIVALLSLL